MDNGNPGSGAACSTGQQGVCSAGTTVCSAGAIACNRNVAPSAETCDGLDNDCNGVVDNGNPGGGTTCSTGQLGVCSAGTTACTSGAIACNQNVAPSAEVCDGKDNDCNGVVDNGNPGGGAACSTGQLGVCAAGTTACTSGAIACNRNVNASAETCDSLDNNCNGLVDDSALIADGNPNTCATAPNKIVNVAAGGQADVSGYIDGTDDYFQVTFNGVGAAGTYYHPKVTLFSNPGTQFKLQVLDGACNPVNGCPGVLDTFEMTYPANPNSCQSYGVCTDTTAKPVTVRVRVTRVAGAPYYCTPYTVRMSNL